MHRRVRGGYETREHAGFYFFVMPVCDGNKFDDVGGGLGKLPATGGAVFAGCAVTGTDCCA